ncbi:DegT/DnrJ/EryC1/StrS family aminotransferase [Achromobacter denitrificans]
MIPRLRPQLGASEWMAALRPRGPDDVAQFETAFAAEMGQRHAIAFPYGRTGLVLLLEAMGLSGREIICPAYTCVVVPHAVVTAGATPVFLDSGANDFNMDLNLVPEAISPVAGAIIATSLFGYPVDLDRLAQLRERYPHMRVIQDCAHSFSAESAGRPVQRYGDAAIFGLNASKLMTSIFGGMVTTDDDALAARLRALRQQRLAPASTAKAIRRTLYLLALYPALSGPIYGLVNRLERSGVLDRFVRYYDESIIDMPSDYLEAMTSVEARVGVAQLRRFSDILARRRHNAAYYFDHLPERQGIVLPPRVEGATYSHYILQVQDREDLMARGLPLGVQFGQLIEYNIPRMATYRGSRYIDRGHADRYARTAFNLPVHCASDGELEHVVSTFAELTAAHAGNGRRKS